MGVMTPTQPAPIIPTLGTRHMVTTSIFLCSILTIGTFYHVFTANIFFDFSIANLITTNSGMAHRSTFEASLLEAYITCSIGFITATTFLSCDEATTAVIGAPFEVGVGFNLNITYKLHVFRYHLFRTKLLNVFFCELLLAIDIHTVDSEDLTIFNISC